jgi:hypothetical protein
VEAKTKLFFMAGSFSYLSACLLPVLRVKKYTADYIAGQGSQ